MNRLIDTLSRRNSLGQLYVQILLLVVSSLLISGCGGSETTAPELAESQAQSGAEGNAGEHAHGAETGQTMTGYVDVKTLTELEAFSAHGDDWVLDQNAASELKAITEPVTLLAFFGTWCHDSQREIPRLVKLLDDVDNRNISLRLYALDTAKKDPANLADTFAVRYTPTIVVLAGHDLKGQSSATELGRIVETPELSLGADLTGILENSKD